MMRYKAPSTTATPPDRNLAKYRVLERHRNRTGWFAEAVEPVWQAPNEGPPLVVFYSFKGGVGRSTALASFAIRRARQGERVVVADFDLDAPGIGLLLASDSAGNTSPWGVVDYLLERPVAEMKFEDYHFPCRRVAGKGEIIVVPAGRLDPNYAEKLARVDLEHHPTDGESPIVTLLQDLKAKLHPHWILLDARSGISAPAGHLLAGLAHLHVLFGVTSGQSWAGLQVLVDRMGRQRVQAGRLQMDCLMVQAMVPANEATARIATNEYLERAERVFRECYYAEEPDDPQDESFWDMRDFDSDDAPHTPIPITYKEELAHFSDIEGQVAELLATSRDYGVLEERIIGRFESPLETES